MRSMMLPHPCLSLLSPHHGQLLTHHYSAISLALPHTELQTAKHTDKQMAVLVSLTLTETRGKQRKREMASGCEFKCGGAG